jgi:hypothetical protein
MISELLIMVQDSIYRQPGLTISPFFTALALKRISRRLLGASL